MNIYTKDGDLFIIHYRDKELVFTKYKRGDTGWSPDGEPVPVTGVQTEIGEPSYLNNEYIGITDRFF